ncbi:hypothetical protein GE21DRAFT_6531 [Neurospora crassa]|uniref:Uncharacterized protein n=1 Tax=Neurospora crassa (strain ATCC 24698 / 74-OR23-1A / CBS 708.71 / DSM 1257 / FGSC 987) TaxID=367110 RepID=Q7S998_NEUCR|nr:hypothetical protein NCU07038 [Neurospora crassa OR74A]EAA32941.2 hypothetical protein NCU07038 [Neurospora crassa OR74A]KHE80957.1 hypothetical protein GE21DRAFT_6531 [Neurospora crassa]|eukprot:XP_962177.2 hypothetical protein NCU07038 [Neurospora crassa OR74A]
MFCGLPIPFRSRSGHNASAMEPRERIKLRKKQKKARLASSDQFQYQGKPPKGPARACNSSKSPKTITPENGPPRPSHSHSRLTPRGNRGSTAHKSFHNAQHGETPNDDTDTENKERNSTKPHSDQSQIQVPPLRRAEAVGIEYI